MLAAGSVEALSALTLTIYLDNANEKLTNLLKAHLE